MVLGDLDRYMQKNENRPPTYYIYKNKLKMNKRLKYKAQHHKVLEENMGRKISDILPSIIFTNICPLEQGI